MMSIDLNTSHIQERATQALSNMAKGALGVNITNDKDIKEDPNYRYKRDLLDIVHEGKGNGGTRIQNSKKVAKQLNRTEQQLSKFICYELGTGTKVKDDGINIIGTHSVKKLESLVELFIQKFVLCPKCKLPETELSVENKVIKHNCKACGAITDPIDPTHKLYKNILSKKADRKSGKASKKADKKSGKVTEENVLHGGFYLPSSMNQF